MTSPYQEMSFHLENQPYISELAMQGVMAILKKHNTNLYLKIKEIVSCVHDTKLQPRKKAQMISRSLANIGSLIQSDRDNRAVKVLGFFISSHLDKEVLKLVYLDAYPRQVVEAYFKS